MEVVFLFLFLQKNKKVIATFISQFELFSSNCEFTSSNRAS